MRLRGLKWLTAALVIGFLFGFDYVRHFVFWDLLHHSHLYLASVTAVCLTILLFNHLIFSWLESVQRELRRQNRRLAALNAVGTTLSRSLDLDELLGDALDQIVATTGVAAAVHLAAPERLIVRAATGQAAGPGAGALREALAGCAANSAGAPDEERYRRALAAVGLEPWAACGLRAKGASVGCLVLVGGQGAAGDEDRQLVEAIGAQLGIAIENATLHGRLAEQAGHLEALIESSGNAIITIDRQGVVRSWNRAAEQIYGWSRDEAVGQVIPMVPPELRDEARAIMARVVQGGKTVPNIETTRLRKDGEQIPVLVTASPVLAADGTTMGLIGVSTDLRDRKRLERDLLRQQRDLAAMAERERLARALHDDVGQVLGYVNMQGQAIGELLAAGRGDLAERQLARMVTMVQEAHDEVRQYILDLRVGSEEGQQLQAALQALVRRYQRHHNFTVELVAERLGEVCLSPGVQTQLLHIVQEALVNARKHARAPQVRVSCARADGGLAVAVADNGRGFDQAADRARGGRHFGLGIMQDRAAEIGGRLEVRSHVGEGTTVTLWVPVSNEEAVAYARAAG